MMKNNVFLIIATVMANFSMKVEAQKLLTERKYWSLIFHVAETPKR